MKTTTKLLCCPAQDMSEIPTDSIDLIVTSPPYPLIKMWDSIFKDQDPNIGAALEAEDGRAAFDRMHQLLDRAWQESWRVLKEGGIACINIGDATRKVAGEFQLFSNHSRILSSFTNLGFTVLPDILWRKPTNSPTKFMGSGMLPGAPYITLEHEYILIFRKGSGRAYKTPEEKKHCGGRAPSSGRRGTSGVLIFGWTSRASHKT